ncbi:MAG TPA: response regulator [Candidatus Eisenbacteria bacterium]|nr:response regulator [Candidatus Eisenbacteria bacterium]
MHELRRKAGALEAETRRLRDLEIELQGRMAELAELDRRKDEFLATLAHELRNPLAPIKMAAMLARSNCECAGSHRYLEMIERQADNLTRIVDDLVEVSRLSHGKLTLMRERIALATVVTRAVDSARAHLEQRQHRVTVALPEEPLLVNADPVRLEQALVNVLVNAARYTPTEGRIDIAVEGEREEALVRVRDNGVGIRPQDLDRVFDLFRQMPERTPGAQGGLGIGLTMARALIELHGGSILASSEGPGAGSEFVIRLPVATPANEAGEVRSAGKSDAPLTPRCRVLIVDDNADAGEALQGLLLSEGHDVRLVRDGRSALRAVRDFAPALVLLDLAMPRMDGFEVARRIRARHPDVRLIAVTGYSQPDHHRRAAEAGISEFLVKPVRVEGLARVLAGVADAVRNRSRPSRARGGLTSGARPA